MPRKRQKNKKYSPEPKVAAVQAYLSGEKSQREICKRFNIPAKRTPIYKLCAALHIPRCSYYKWLKRDEDYIHFYNTKRYQKRLCCMTPMEFHAAA